MAVNTRRSGRMEGRATLRCTRHRRNDTPLETHTPRPGQNICSNGILHNLTCVIQYEAYTRQASLRYPPFIQSTTPREQSVLCAVFCLVTKSFGSLHISLTSPRHDAMRRLTSLVPTVSAGCHQMYAREAGVYFNWN